MSRSSAKAGMERSGSSTAFHTAGIPAFAEVSARSRLPGANANQASPAEVKTRPDAAMERVPSTMRATKPPASSQNPVKRSRKRIMGRRAAPCSEGSTAPI